MRSSIRNKLLSKNAVGVISAFRSAYDLADNLERTRNLQRDLDDAGVTYYRVYGHYAEDGKPRKREISFVAFSDDTESLETILRRLGAKYNQDSVVVKSGGSARLVGTSGEDESGRKINYPGLGVEIELGDSDLESLSKFISRVRGSDFKVESSSLCTFGDFIADKTTGG